MATTCSASSSCSRWELAWPPPPTRSPRLLPRLSPLPCLCPALASSPTVRASTAHRASPAQVMLDLGLVTGDTKAEKEEQLEREFLLADEDDSGAVDYDATA